MGDIDSRDGENAAEYISHMLRWEDRFLDRDIKEIKKILFSPAYNRVNLAPIGSDSNSKLCELLEILFI